MAAGVAKVDRVVPRHGLAKMALQIEKPVRETGGFIRDQCGFRRIERLDRIERGEEHGFPAAYQLRRPVTHELIPARSMIDAAHDPLRVADEHARARGWNGHRRG